MVFFLSHDFFLLHLDLFFLLLLLLFYAFLLLDLVLLFQIVNFQGFFPGFLNFFQGFHLFKLEQFDPVVKHLLIVLQLLSFPFCPVVLGNIAIVKLPKDRILGCELKFVKEFIVFLGIDIHEWLRKHIWLSILGIIVC